MKKILMALVTCSLCASALLAGCAGGEKAETKSTSTEKELVKVTLNEVAHSIFYAPQYVAIEEGYFTKEGIKLELVTGFGAIH